MKLIAEAGATKIQWGLVTQNNVFEFITSGFNPNVSDRNYLRQLLVSGFPNQFNPKEVRAIKYFGAGCASSKNKAEVKRALDNFFTDTVSVEIFSDLEAGGKAILNNASGYVGILGTGSSFAHYNNGKIIKQAPSLGYLLGDEGSGAYLGKELLIRLLHNKLDTPLTELFFKEYKTHKDKLVRELYQSKMPNAFLASFSTFIGKNRHNATIKEIINTSFNQFIDYYVVPTVTSDLPIGLIGGVAKAFQNELEHIFRDKGFQKPIVLHRPFERLLQV